MGKQRREKSSSKREETETREVDEEIKETPEHANKEEKPAEDPAPYTFEVTMPDHTEATDNSLPREGLEETPVPVPSETQYYYQEEQVPKEEEEEEEEDDEPPSAGYIRILKRRDEIHAKSKKLGIKKTITKRSNYNNVLFV
jgi:hypothetical protein